ncbi:MAG: Cu2+-exporting ATPase, partial [Bacteroidia bacterium]
MEQVINNENIKASYKVSGMTCAACAISVESYLSPLTGIHNIAVNYPNQSVSIDYDSTKITIETIQEKIKKIGYDILLGDTKETQKAFENVKEKRLETLKSKLMFSAIFSIPIFIMAMFFTGEIPYENWIMMVLSIPVLFWSGAEFYSIAWKKLKHFSANMDTLVTLSTGVAFVFSAFNTVYPR